MHRWEVICVTNHPYLETTIGEPKVVSQHLFRRVADHTCAEYNRLSQKTVWAFAALNLNPLNTYIVRRAR